VANSSNSSFPCVTDSLAIDIGPILARLFPGSPKHLAVAVSGGADSLSLVWLLKEWSLDTGCRITALTVDHGLRPASPGEADEVARWMAAWGLPHETLTWQGDKPVHGIQEAAREARYALLTDWCRENGAEALMVAHHREDQAETFLMRLLRGSGPDGLAAMRPVSRLNGVRIVRPLLDVSKEQLVGLLKGLGQSWINDPSNEDTRFTRAKLRAWMPKLEEQEIDAARLSRLAGDFGELREKLDAVTREAITSLVRFDAGGWAELPRQILRDAPDPLAKRLIVSVMNSVGGGGYAPRSDRLDRGLAKLRTNEPLLAFSLGGCVLLEKNHKIMILREERRGTPPTVVQPGDRIVWRNRFLCEFGQVSTPGRPPYVLAPLKKEGWTEALKWEPNLRNLGVYHACAATLPALYDSEGLLEVPRLCIRRPDASGDGASAGNSALKFEKAEYFHNFEELRDQMSL